MHCKNLCELIQQRANVHHIGVTFINGKEQENYLSYANMYKSALQTLGLLQIAGVKKGDELVLQSDNNQTLIISFWACILGGILPVPLTMDGGHEHRMKVFNVWTMLTNPWLLITSADADEFETFATSNGLSDTYQQMCKRLVKPNQGLSSVPYGKIESVEENDIAFIQFSSGSTGTPKGVKLTHRNLLSNVKAIEIASAYTPADSLLSWMPLTHDMGLIGFHISPLFSGLNHFIIPTSVFIRRPTIWFDAVSNHRTSVLCSPNFGYEYVLKSLKHTTYNWDLRDVRIIYNGAEPVSVKICSRFLSTFKQYGLRSNSMCPVYGLAENSLAVTISETNDKVSSIKLSRTNLSIGKAIKIISAEDEGITFVNLGKAVPYCEIMITDETGNFLPAETIGCLLIKGQSLTSGYYNSVAETNSAINNEGWLNTGDLGFLKDDCLYITGRTKDILFCSGQNFYAHDIEALAQDAAGIALNKVAVAGSFSAQSEHEEIIAFVVFKGKLDVFVNTVKILKTQISKKAGVELTHVLPVKNIPRTTSGKLQRYKLMEQYHNGDFDDVVKQLYIIINQKAANFEQNTTNISDTEREIFEIWKQILKGKIVDPKADFFENGGNSIKAVELQVRILKKWSVELDVAAFRQNSTLNDIALLIKNGKYKQYIPYNKSFSSAIGEVLPLSSFQKGIYYHWVVNQLSTAYNIPLALLIRGDLNAAAITDALKTLVERYDSLRGVFVNGTNPGFVIKENVDVKVEKIELHGQDWFTKIQKYVQPFNLYNDLLFRFTLLEVNKTKHILLLDFHHIIADGLSINLFVNELINLINGESIAGLPAQYRDFIMHELAEDKELKQLPDDYWAEKLSGELPLLSLTTDHSRPALFDYRGERLFFTLDNVQRSNLSTMAKRENCTLHALLFALYKLLLYKYTHQNDIVIGIPVAVRNHPDLLDVFGMMVNNLAVRQAIDSNMSLIDYFKSEADNLSKALKHKEFPFEDQVKLIGKTREVSRNLLFDTMFVFQNMIDDLPGSNNLSYKVLPFDQGISKYDLSLEIFDNGTVLEGCFEFCNSLFDRKTIEKMLSHFNSIVDQLVTNPYQTVRDLSILVDSERKMLAGYNATEVAYPFDKTIFELFKDQVFKTPENTALIFNSKHITYRALYSDIEALAVDLQFAGLKRGVVAGIYLRRSPDTILAILAVLLTGATYLPIDTELPVSRVHFMLNDSRCGLLITNATSSFDLESDGSISGFNIFYLDKANEAFASPTVLARQAGLDSAAYIIYTSGSTGNPKGVLVEQRSVVNYITWAAKKYLRVQHECFAFFTSISFDLTVTSIFTPLITGNTIIVYDNNESDKTIIETVINDSKVTIVKLTPSHLRILADCYLNSPPIFSNVKTFVVGGEKLASSLANDIFNLFGKNIDIYNEYGPTEATVGCTIHRYDPNENYESVPIGKPINNVRIYLLDDDLSMVPVGVPGELFIAGDCLAKGYLFNSDSTADKFVPDPFFKGAKMYSTGDRGLLSAEGKMEYLGRFDSQVKINGYRIELIEIEQTLKEFPAISEAIVTVDKTEQNSLIIAYYISKEIIESIELRAFLTSKLPYYMVPASLIRISEIPLTPNHKIDFTALASFVTKLPVSSTIVPKDHIELAIISIWEEVLKQTNLTSDANFFKMGGDSIKAFQISSRLFDLGIDIAARDILVGRTLDQVVKSAKASNSTTNSSQKSLTGNLELSPAASWFINRNFEYPGYYHQTLLLNLHRQPDVGLFERAFDHIIKSHDGLRLNYDGEKNMLFYNQRHLGKKFSIGVVADINLQSLVEILQNLELNTQEGFCIQNDLLLRAKLFSLNDSTHVLAICAHHLIIDAVSWRILLEEIYSTYSALEQGTIPLVYPKTASLKDWQSAIQDRRKSAAYKGLAKDWITDEYQQVSLPVANTQSKQLNGDTFKVRFFLNADVKYLLKEAPLKYSFDPGLLLFGSFLEMMQQWTNNDEFLITKEYHGRDFESFNFSKTIGWFTAIYPCIWKWRGSNLIDKLNMLKQQISANSSKATNYSIWKYTETNAGSKDITKANLQYNYLGEFGDELSNDLFSYNNLSPLLQSHPNNPLTSKIEVNAMIVNKQLYVEIIADGKEFLPETIQEVIDIWTTALNQIIAELKDLSSDLQNIKLSNIVLSKGEIDSLFN